MTRLIDADDVLKEISSSDDVFVTEAEQEYLWERMQMLPTVDAIPTAWILDWIQYMEQYYGYYTEIIHAMLEDWRTERNE